MNYSVLKKQVFKPRVHLSDYLYNVMDSNILESYENTEVKEQVDADNICKTRDIIYVFEQLLEEEEKLLFHPYDQKMNLSRKEWQIKLKHVLDEHCSKIEEKLRENGLIKPTAKTALTRTSFHKHKQIVAGLFEVNAKRNKK